MSLSALVIGKAISISHKAIINNRIVPGDQRKSSKSSPVKNNSRTSEITAGERIVAQQKLSNTAMAIILYRCFRNRDVRTRNSAFAIEGHLPLKLIYSRFRPLRVKGLARNKPFFI